MKIKLILALLLQFLCINVGAESFPTMFNKSGKNAPNSYAIVVVGRQCGSTTEEQRHLYEGAKTYQFFTKFMGIPKGNIRVCIGEYSSRNADLDNDGSNDVNYRATNSGIESAIDAISSIAGSNDEFYFFAIDHGGVDLMCINESLLSSSLARYIKKIPCNRVNVWLHACHSGSFIDELKTHNRKTLIVTSTSGDRTSYSGNNLGSYLFDPFYAALAGSYKIKNHTVGNNVADYNGDGSVSYEEAFVYAKDHDDYAYPYGRTLTQYNNGDSEIPRFWYSETDYRFCRDKLWGVLPTIGNVSNTRTTEAMYLMTLNGTVSASADLTLHSGKIIRFKQGFKTQKGAHLLAQIVDCENEKQRNPAELRKMHLTEEEIAEEVTEESVASIEVAPNPSNGIFTVTLGENETDITLMDTQGRILRSYNRVSGNFEIDITDAPNGMYLMVLASDSFKITRKIVKY